MPILASEIDARLSDILNDAERVRWPLPERLRWINDAATAVVTLRWGAGATSTALELAAGTRQGLPEGAIGLIDIPRNLAADGVTPGRMIRRTERNLLDDQDPSWHTAKPVAVVKHFAYDDEDPLVFWCYPPARAGTKVQAIVAQPPAEVTAPEQEIALDRVYIGPLVSYALYLCLAKDSEYANGQLAAAHYSAFANAMGIQSTVAATNAQNTGAE